MDSFYGGQPGISFIIVESYNSVKEMLDAFKQGGAYEKVKYGEYVIIDTIVNNNDKNSLENGLIYCRGFDYQESYTKVPNIDDYREGEFNNVNKNKYELAMRKYFKKPGAGAVYVGQIVGPQGETPRVEVLSEKYIISHYTDEFKGSGTLDIVSGKTQNKITYAYCNIRDELDNIVGCVIGITIPYHVIEIHGESVSPYDSSVGTYNSSQDEWSYANLINKEQGNTDDRPFYSLWQLKVPKGIHGIDLSTIGIDKADQQYYYETRNYNASKEGKVTRYKLGVYHKVIVSTTFDEATSDFVITYTTGDTDRIKARFLYDIIVDPTTNRLKVFYSDYENGAHVSKLIGDPIKFIDRIEYDEATQKLIVFYNTIKDGAQEKSIIEKKFKVIEKIELNNDNKLVIYYNTYDDVTKKQDTYTIDYAFKFLSDIKINSTSQKVEITYVVGTSASGDPIYKTETIGSALNYIKEVIVNPKTYHLLVLYSDPAMRAAASAAGKAETCNDHSGVSHTDWWNLGNVRGESGGIHIIGDVDSEEKLPAGGPPDPYQGWIYTVTKNGASMLYAYDYDKSIWYPIGSLDSSLVNPKSVLIVSEADAEGYAPISEDSAILNVGGYWLVLE